MRYVVLVLALLLAGCGGSSNPPPPPPPPALFPLTIGPGAPWMVTQGSPGIIGQALSNGSFSFPQCSSASTCWASYVEAGLSANLSTAKSITLNYTITGNAPVFVNDSPGNAGRGPPALSLLLHRSGDAALVLLTYRQFSFASRQPLALGSNSYTVTLDQTNWINVSGVGFGDTLSNIGSIGFVLGGGDFAGHGVAVAQGSATLTINSLTVN